MLLDRPFPSVTMSVTKCRPGREYLLTTRALPDLASACLSKLHEYATIPTSSEDAPASKVHVRPEHDAVKRATGGAFTGGVTVTVTCFVTTPLLTGLSVSQISSVTA